jgi:hypothetical protein
MNKVKVTTAAVLLALFTSATHARADEAVAQGGVSTNFSAKASGEASEPGSSALPWIIGGLGVAQIAVGIILVAAAPETPDNCNEDTRTCARKTGQSDASLREDQEQAGEAKHMPTLGAIAVVSGAAFVATGLAMYFWYKPDGAKNARGPSITPYVAPSGGGLAARASF